MSHTLAVLGWMNGRMMGVVSLTSFGHSCRKTIGPSGSSKSLAFRTYSIYHNSINQTKFKNQISIRNYLIGFSVSFGAISILGLLLIIFGIYA